MMNKRNAASLLGSKAEVRSDKYGVTLTTSRAQGNSVEIAMNPELALITIEVLHEYLEGLKSIKEGKE